MLCVVGTIQFGAPITYGMPVCHDKAGAHITYGDDMCGKARAALTGTGCTKLVRLCH